MADGPIPQNLRVSRVEQTIDAHRTGGRQEEQAHAEQEKHHGLHVPNLVSPLSPVKDAQALMNRFSFEFDLSASGRVERPRSTAADQGGQPYL